MSFFISKTLCTRIDVPEELMAASCSKCSSTCSCREKLSLQTSEHMGQSNFVSPRKERQNKSQFYMSSKNTEVAKRSWTEHKGTNNGHTMGVTTPESPRGCRAQNAPLMRQKLIISVAIFEFSQFSHRWWCSTPPPWLLWPLVFRTELYFLTDTQQACLMVTAREHDDMNRNLGAVLGDVTQRAPAEWDNCCRPVNTSDRPVSPVCLRHKRHN